MSTDSTRWSLVRGAAAGVPADRDEFALRYGSTVRTYLAARWRRTPLSEEVEDAAQQVFLDCFKENGALESIDPEHGSGFRAYLYGVARKVALAMERKRGRSREKQATSRLDLDEFAGREDSLAKAFDREWARGVLHQAAELQLARARANGPDAVQRHRLLELRFGENLPIREIAARWGVDADRLHRDYPKAREEFKQALLDVVAGVQGGSAKAVEAECERLLGHFS